MALRTLVFFDATDGEASELQPTLDSFQINNIGLVGTTPDITGLPATPPGATSAASKAYVDSLANGLDWKESVRVATAADLPANTPAGSGVGKTLTADAVGILTVDGVNTVLGDRILVKDYGGGASSSHNGIYEVTTEGTAGVAFVLTRATDQDEDAEMTAGNSVFAEEGTANADKGFVLVTNDPITVDTTATQYSQFTAATALTAGAGLLDTANTWSVELDTAADAQSAGTAGGSSGLEFDAAGDAGQLRVAVDPDAGIQRDAAGIGLLLDGTSLSTSASGVKVGHGPRIENEISFGAAVNAGDPVYWDGTNDQAAAGDAAVKAESQIMGVSVDTLGGAGTATVVSHGLAAGAIAGATAGDRYFLASGGGLTTTLPTGNVERVKCGYAINATDLWVEIEIIGRSGTGGS